MEKELVDFLHYVEKSCDENVPEDCDKRLKDLHEKVKAIKADRQMGVSYMKTEERDRLIREEGREEGKEEGLETGRSEGEMLKLMSQIQKKVLKGKNAEEIAEDLDEEVGNIREIYDAVIQNKEGSRAEILNLLLHKKG